MNLTVTLQVDGVHAVLRAHDQPVLVDGRGGEGVLDHRHLVVHHLFALVDSPTIMIMIAIIICIIKNVYNNNNNNVPLIVLIILIPINHNNNMNCPIQSFPKYFISILLTLLTKSTNELYEFKTSLILITIETIINHFLSG